MCVVSVFNQWAAHCRFDVDGELIKRYLWCLHQLQHFVLPLLAPLRQTAALPAPELKYSASASSWEWTGFIDTTGTHDWNLETVKKQTSPCPLGIQLTIPFMSWIISGCVVHVRSTGENGHNSVRYTWFVLSAVLGSETLAFLVRNENSLSIMQMFINYLSMWNFLFATYCSKTCINVTIIICLMLFTFVFYHS